MIGGRPLDWSAVGWDRDPTPGDPEVVADLSERFRRTAEAVRTAADGLNRIHSSDSYEGKGGEKLRERTRDLAAKVEEVHQRYAGAAEALQAYHPEQYAAQQLADDALRRATDAQSLASHSSSTLSQIPDAPTDGTTEDFTVTMARSRAQQGQQEAASTLAQAKADVQRAHEWQQEAGARAAAKLQDVISNDGLNDSTWDDVKGNTIDHIHWTGLLKFVAKWADRIATVAAVLALAVSWIPVVGQVAGAVLGAVALVATAVGFLSHLALLLRGDEGWSGVIWDGVGLLTFGAGRILKTSSRFTVALAHSKAWTAAREIVDSKVTSRVRYANVRQLVGSTKFPAAKLARQASRSGLVRTTLRNAPRDYARDVWGAVGRSRAPFSVRAAAREFVAPGLEAYEPLGRLAPELAAVPEVQRAVRVARANQVAQAVNEWVDRVHTAHDVNKEMHGEGEESSIAIADLPREAGSRLQHEQLRLDRARAVADIRFTRHVITTVLAKPKVRGRTGADEDLVRS